MRFITTVLLLAVFAGVAAAQQNPNQPSTNDQTVAPPSAAYDMATPRPQAPVGHRQPTQNSLPPNVRNSEDSLGNTGSDPYGALPQICRGC